MRLVRVNVRFAREPGFASCKKPASAVACARPQNSACSPPTRAAVNPDEVLEGRLGEGRERAARGGRRGEETSPDRLDQKNVLPLQCLSVGPMPSAYPSGWLNWQLW